MLINHDFDWESELEDAPQPGVEPRSGKGTTPGPARPDRSGHIRPREQVVIIERDRGLSRSTLLLALVALALSVASAVSNQLGRDAAITIDRPEPHSRQASPANSDRPAVQANDPRAGR